MLKGSPAIDERLALGSRILDLADDLSHWSESTGALSCTFFSDAHRAVARGFTDIGMLFVRCGNGGISHSPRETVTAEDAGIAAQILRDTLVRMAT